MKKTFLIILVCMFFLFLIYLFFAITGFNNWIVDYPNDKVNRIYFMLRMFRNGIIFSLLINILLIVFSSIFRDKKGIICNIIVFIISIVSLIVSNIYIDDLKEVLIICLSVISYVSCFIGIFLMFKKWVYKNE